MDQSNRYQFLASRYLATGEGLTVCLLITLAQPDQNLDYSEPPSFDENWKYNPGQLKTTVEQRAHREFVSLFGDWYAIGMENLSQDEFFQRFDSYIPNTIRNIVEDEESPPGNFHYDAKMHVNFS